MERLLQCLWEDGLWEHAGLLSASRRRRDYDINDQPAQGGGRKRQRVPIIPLQWRGVWNGWGGRLLNRGGWDRFGGRWNICKTYREEKAKSDEGSLSRILR